MRMLCRGGDVFCYGLYGSVAVAKPIFVLRLVFDIRIFCHVDTGLRTWELLSQTIATVEPQGRYGYLLWKALFVCVGGARREKGCNHCVYLYNFFRQ